MQELGSEHYEVGDEVISSSPLVARLPRICTSSGEFERPRQIDHTQGACDAAARRETYVRLRNMNRRSGAPFPG